MKSIGRIRAVVIAALILFAVGVPATIVLLSTSATRDADVAVVEGQGEKIERGAQRQGQQRDRQELDRETTEAVVACFQDLEACLAGRTGAAGDLGLRGEEGQSITGDTGETGRPGESITGDTGDTGRQGDPGESVVGPEGPMVPLAVVAQFVEQFIDNYCATRDECRGPPGADGEDGAPGTNATDEQVAAAVAAFFGAHTFACDFDVLTMMAQNCTVDP